jgi:hypothetical protein
MARRNTQSFANFCASAAVLPIRQTGYETWFIYRHGSNPGVFSDSLHTMQYFATMIAVFATKNSHFALAQKRESGHTKLAFQASSPKTSTARSATTGPFFVPETGPPPCLRNGNRAPSYRLVEIAPFAILGADT